MMGVELYLDPSIIKQIAREALEKECKCSIPHKKIRIIGDAISSQIGRVLRVKR